MENRKLPAAIAVFLIVVAVALFLFLGDDDTADQSTELTSSESTQTSQNGGASGGKKEPTEDVTVIEIKDGGPVGGVQDLEFTAGDEIRFIVKSDADYEIHFHGYDVMMDVAAGDQVEFDVPASIEGVFEAEIEDTATQIAEISVVPS